MDSFIDLFITLHKIGTFICFYISMVHWNCPTLVTKNNNTINNKNKENRHGYNCILVFSISNVHNQYL